MSQLSVEARPRTFGEVAGQSIAKSILNKIAKNPKDSPKVIQLYGGFGCGKTSLARIFASEVSGVPYDDLPTTPYLQELDSSQINKDTITNLIDTWYASPSGSYRTIIIDENHLLSKQVQSSLLKVLEDMPKNTFIIFCTTDYELVLNTIKSRSLEIKLEPVPAAEVKSNIYSVCEKFGIEMDDEVAERIVQISKGHMRTVHQNISKYDLLGREDYLSLFHSAYDEINNFFTHIGQRNTAACFKDIDAIITFPLATIKDDFNQYILSSLKDYIRGGNEMTKLFGSNFLTIVKLTQAEWFKSSFTSDVELQTGLLAFISQLTSSSSQSQVSRPVQTGARR